MNSEILRFFNESYLQWIALIFAISLMIWGAMRIRAYFLEESNTIDDNYRLLNELRDLKTQGQLPEEEYRKVKSRIKRESTETDNQDSEDKETT